MLVAATEMYGSGGQAAFGSLGVSDEGGQVVFGSLGVTDEFRKSLRMRRLDLTQSQC